MPVATATKKVETKPVEVKKEETKTTKPVVVKKVAHTKPAEKVDDKQIKLAINKYKDIPLGELYEDLNGTEAYKEILRARRDELLKAKAIVDSSKRKIAIAKTSENTVDIEFRYQKNATFKNHYIPKGNYNIVNSGNDANQTENLPRRERVLERSQERVVSDAPQGSASFAGINLNRQPSSGPRQVNITSSLEQRADRPIAAQAPMAQHQPMPQPAHEPRQVMTSQMTDRAMPVRPNAAAPMPQPQPAPMMAQPMPQAAPMMQPMMAQPMPQPQAAPMMQQPMPQPQPAAQPVQVVKPAIDPQAHKKHKLWPLYEQIELASEKNKSSKVIFGFTVALSAILAALIGLFVLWGFAVHWNWPDFQNIPFVDAFKNLFNVF